MGVHFAANTKLKLYLRTRCCYFTLCEWERLMDRRRNSRGGGNLKLPALPIILAIHATSDAVQSEASAGLTCALSKVLHCDVLVLPTSYGPQLALVGIGHPI